MSILPWVRPDWVIAVETRCRRSCVNCTIGTVRSTVISTSKSLSPFSSLIRTAERSSLPTRRHHGFTSRVTPGVLQTVVTITPARSSMASSPVNNAPETLKAFSDSARHIRDEDVDSFRASTKLASHRRHNAVAQALGAIGYPYPSCDR